MHLKTVSEAASLLRLPLDTVRQGVRETGVGVSRHIDGHWQRRLRPDDVAEIWAWHVRKDQERYFRMLASLIRLHPKLV
jgi:hypothetical protein